VLYRCYAKINLTLEVLGRRGDDGYHDLASLVHTISLADELRIEPADDLLIRMEGLEIEPETNLVSRAARLLASATGARAGAQLTLVKRIPAAAGLGGGSSDAATTLVGLNTFWRTRLRLADLSALAAELGSDVPFFIRGGAALMLGRGDDLTVLPPLKGQWLIVVVPLHVIDEKTRRLYGALNVTDFSTGKPTEMAAQRLRRQQRPLEDHLINGFYRAARQVFPGLSETWTDVERLAERRFFLSGAGPALFAFAESGADARQQVARLRRPDLAAFASRTTRHARAAIKFAAGAPIGYP
jgi:4-diphosphocytidyl-2-C-methyl-D-erythritol kinase